MKERPIPLKAHEVRSILEGRQTQLRRVVRPQPTERGEHINWRRYRVIGNEIVQEVQLVDGSHRYERTIHCPFGQPGDRLWVRETWNSGWCDKIIYRADGGSAKRAGYAKEPRWRPSIHMPRWASRITLEITNVRVERLKEISEEDAKAEGVRAFTKDGVLKKFFIEDGDYTWADAPRFPRTAFSMLWDSINLKRGFGWDANPWVWVIEFKKI